MLRFGRLTRVGGRSFAALALAGAVFAAATPARAEASPIERTGSAQDVGHPIRARFCGLAAKARDADAGGRIAVFNNCRPPGAPTDLTAVAGDQVAELTFGAASDNDDPVVGYELSVDGGDNWAPFAATDNGDDTLSGTAPGLTAKTTYQFVVRGVGLDSTGDPSTPLTFVAATLPAAPTALTTSPGNGRLFLTFPAADGMGRPVLHYETRIDGSGIWSNLDDMDAGGGFRTGTVEGLTNDVSAAIEVRAVNAIGAGDPSAPADGTPLAPAAAPETVTAVAGTSSATVSWPAATGDDAEVTGYRVTASPGPATCETTTELSCVIGGEAGVTYTYSVVALSASGDSTLATVSEPVTPTMPEPPAVPPAGAFELTTTNGAITTAEPGQQITFLGSGFVTYSTVVFSVYSDPEVVAAVITNADGAFRRRVIVPADLAPGTHTILAQGVDADGNPRFLSVAVTVAAPADATPAEPDPALPITGGSPWPAGLLLVILGLILLTGSAHRPLRVRLYPRP